MRKKVQMVFYLTVSESLNHDAKLEKQAGKSHFVRLISDP